MSGASNASSFFTTISPSLQKIQMDLESENLTKSNQSLSRESLCSDIGQTFHNGTYLVVFHFHLVLLATILVAIGVLVRQYWHHKIVMHGNLLILLVNLVIVYFIHTLSQFAWLFRYRIILFYYTDPCQLLTPLWMVTFFYGPVFLQTVACPCLHFCVMVERVRATVFAANYEREGKRWGGWMVAIVWLLAWAFLGFILVTAVIDPTVPAEMGVIYLASTYSTPLIFNVNIATLVLVIVTALCDLRVTLINKQLRKTRLSNNTAGYSLSRNYQLNENTLAMRLILPLDIVYALLYSLYSGLTVYVRAYRATMPIAEFRFYTNCINTILFLYTAITLFVYIHFVHFVSKCQRRNVNARSREENVQSYFNQLHAQWGVPK